MRIKSRWCLNRKETLLHFCPHTGVGKVKANNSLQNNIFSTNKGIKVTVINRVKACIFPQIGLCFVPHQGPDAYHAVYEVTQSLLGALGLELAAVDVMVLFEKPEA